MVVYPNLSDPEAGYPKLMLEYLPTGLLGLMLTAFLAAFMSTIDTHLNWGASYLVNDFYKRFFKPEADDRHYVVASRISVVLIMLVAGVTSLFMDSIAGAWKFLIALNAGIGLVQILRWYWWRINAWSEIAAMVTSAVVSTIVFTLPQTKDNFAYQMLIIVPTSTLIWFVTTLVTAPVSEERLIAFYQRVRPNGGWWGRIPSLANVQPIGESKYASTAQLGVGFGIRLLHTVWVRQIAIGILRCRRPFSADCANHGNIDLSRIADSIKYQQVVSDA